MSEPTWDGALAGAGRTGALIALMYGVMRLVRRSRCASHTRCCDIDVARSQEGTLRETREEIIMQVMEELRNAAKKRKKSSDD